MYIYLLRLLCTCSPVFSWRFLPLVVSPSFCVRRVFRVWDLITWHWAAWFVIRWLCFTSVDHHVLWPVLHLSPVIKGKGKEEYLYSAFLAKVVHSKCSGMDHTVLPANNAMPAFPSWAFTIWHHHSNWGSGHAIAAHYSFIDPERMKGWVGLVGWPIVDGLPT